MLNMLKQPVAEAVDRDAFRDALGHFASGVTVITTVDAGGTPHGMTATAFSSLSLHPPLVLVAVARGTRCHRQVAAERRFGVSILHAHQADLSRQFGGRPSLAVKPQFADLAGMPVLGDSMVMLACTLEEILQGGDHSIFTGLVIAAHTTGGEPLIHYQGRYRSLSKDMA